MCFVVFVGRCLLFVVCVVVNCRVLFVACCELCVVWCVCRLWFIDCCVLCVDSLLLCCVSGVLFFVVCR